MSTSEDKPPERIPVRIFISYAPEDSTQFARLDKHLAMMQRERLVDTWDTRRLEPGEDWRGVVHAQLDAAQIVLLLISADFISSEYCFDVEMTRALERAALRQAVVIPIILRPCDWETAPFGKLRPLPAGGQPLSGAEDLDHAFTSIAKAIRSLAERMGSSLLQSSMHRSVVQTLDDGELIAVGPDVIAWGDLQGASGSLWSLHLIEPFLLGDRAALAHFADSFESYPEGERYIIATKHGGRMVAKSPTWRRTADGVVLEVSVVPPRERVDARTLPEDMKIRLDPLPMDLTFEMVSGVESVGQHITIALCACKGGWGYGAEFGSRVAELHERFGADLLPQITTMELIRLATVPHVDSFTGEVYVPLAFIERVRSVHVAPVDDPELARANLVLDIHGVRGPWRGIANMDLSTKFLGPEPPSLWPTGGP